MCHHELTQCKIIRVNWSVCGLVNPLLGENVPTKMAISEIFVLVETFFSPHEENSI